MGLEERGKQLLLFPNGRGALEFPQHSGSVTGEWRDSVFVTGYGTRRYRMEFASASASASAGAGSTLSTGLGGASTASTASTTAGPVVAPQQSVTVEYEGEFAGADLQRHGIGTLRMGGACALFPLSPSPSSSLLLSLLRNFFDVLHQTKLQSTI
jgi:hypothetical protein